MKKTIIIFALTALSLGGITACNHGGQSTTKHQKKGKYICTMHPNVSADKPGVCPKCGMELVERDTTDDK
ncbi:heavy metal-binding domain-containing protein [Mucilaginibacter sp. SP1R1]|uniref:heavy metal-binding domain-containing protein n=1 Tax=Mucilaginibacter sp. SP1R1 TaxID=2723091 RepID=UPI001611DFBC|nr:heavy metal-binding domain-containing protein [Mucilaginibacter sp. SP1R1]MBB6147903.1 hypothetical protein [Mucilaginibacter sp. SP1R1]